MAKYAEILNTKTILKRDTIYNADCIDFCPIEPFMKYFVVGTYQLIKKSEGKDEREGRLYLFTLTEDNVIQKQKIDMPGILDVRWCPHKINDQVVLGLVNAAGLLILYSLENQGVLKEIFRIQVTESLSLYLDWSSRLKEDKNPSVIVSDSLGFVHIFTFSSFQLNFEQKIKAHQFEAWATSFDYWNPSIVYSGADDCLFKGFDIRSNSSVIFSKKHDAGVTAIQPSLWREELLFSGCYDGILKCWDTRTLKSPITESNLRGGVWRLRSEPHLKPLLLTSLMHNGFQILEIDENSNPRNICDYTEHDSLAYGADWCWTKPNNKYLAGSVSFYDHLLCLWEFDVRNESKM